MKVRGRLGDTLKHWARDKFGVPDDPFVGPARSLWRPVEMAAPPALRETYPSPPPGGRHALLINPFYAKDPHASYGKHVLTPSLALTSVAAATPAGWTVRYWDENLLQGPPPIEPMPAVVGITVHLTFAQRAYELAAYYRRAGVKVVLGGLHAISCPDEVAPHADVLVVGDGVRLWPRILEDFEAGKLQARYELMYDTDYNEDPAPRRELVPKRSFLTTASLIATRGCHNRCGFCYLSTHGLRIPYRMRHPADVALQFLATRQPYGVFIDNNLGSDRNYLRSLCGALRPLRKIWSAAVTLDVTDEPVVIRDMALAGCTGVFIGFESLSDENLEQARKRTPRTEDYARRVRLFHDHGIQVNGSFVLGFDGDRRDVFRQTAEWVEATRMECATFHILTPYPGTPLFRQMESEGRLLHKDWSRYDTAHAVFRPRHMTAEELERGYDWIYRRLFSHTSIWKRRPADLATLPAYLAGCYLYKRANRYWRFLIRHRLVHMAWRPLIEWMRLRHLIYRHRLSTRLLASETADLGLPAVVVPPGV